eukprot:11651345-Alexandrium_andersonii.AAC.1
MTALLRCWTTATSSSRACGATISMAPCPSRPPWRISGKTAACHGLVCWKRAELQSTFSVEKSA